MEARALRTPKFFSLFQDSGYYKAGLGQIRNLRPPVDGVTFQGLPENKLFHELESSIQAYALGQVEQAGGKPPKMLVL